MRYEEEIEQCKKEFKQLIDVINLRRNKLNALVTHAALFSNGENQSPPTLAFQRGSAVLAHQEIRRLNRVMEESRKLFQKCLSMDPEQYQAMTEKDLLNELFEHDAAKVTDSYIVNDDGFYCQDPEDSSSDENDDNCDAFDPLPAGVGLADVQSSSDELEDAVQDMWMIHSSK